MKKVRIIKKTGLMVGNDFYNYAEMSPYVFLHTFLPQNSTYRLVEENEEANICCYGPGLKDDNVLRDNELNVFISVENLKHLIITCA